MGKGSKKAKKKAKSSPAEKTDPLFALNIIRTDPGSLYGAELDSVVLCEDGEYYAIKGRDVHEHIPHDEWFCAKLAHHVGIPCPPCAYINDGKGGHSFGSQWQGGAPREGIATLITRAELELATVAPVLSRILAFDLFVHNEDRHLENFVVHPTKNGWAISCIDHARAWLFNGFPPSQLPMRVSTNTIREYRLLKDAVGDFFDPGAANRVLERIAATTEQKISRIIQDHPAEWLSSTMRDSILAWWRSDKRLQRIDLIKRGLQDGSYL